MSQSDIQCGVVTLTQDSTFFKKADIWPMKDSADPLEGWPSKEVADHQVGLQLLTSTASFSTMFMTCFGSLWIDYRP